MSIMNGKSYSCGVTARSLLLSDAGVGRSASLRRRHQDRLSPDADTSVVAVRLVKKGEELKAPDAPQPITAAADLCLVKLLVGPGATAEKDKNARS